MLALCPLSVSAEGAAQITEVAVGIPIEERPELFLPRSMPTHGNGKVAVFLIEFPDYKNNNPVATQEYYNELYFGDGVYTSWNGRSNVSVAGFYREQSYGKLNLSGRVFDWYTAKHERSYYDNNKAELIMEAAEYYVAQGTSFADFDGDGNGIIDAIAFHFAGEYSGDSNSPWYSGAEYENGGNPFGEIDKMKFTTLVQVAEAAKERFEVWDLNIPSIICHELGHTLGLHDLYGMTRPGMNPTFDLMSKNENTINPYTKIVLGWIDTVSVITGGVSGVRLEEYEKNKSGSVAIVCNEFSGFFDEFYVIAHRNFDGRDTASAWHIDARINKDGTAFMYDNTTFDFAPEQDNAHDTGNGSTYAFIEELCGNGTESFLTDFPEVNDASFLSGGAIGPNGNPSSDTHDGKYTGIRIDNFILHSYTANKDSASYITFDVSMVKDSTPPQVVTKEEELEFLSRITVALSEAVYKGASWDNISVTDLDGKPLDATVVISHYPRNQIKITFEGEAYKNGYRIILPEGCVKDSSGNGIKATTLTAKPLEYFFPTSSTELPPAEYTRNNAEGHFFVTDEGFDVLTFLWDFSQELGYNVPSAKIELMRFDHDGNVIGQFIADNPIKNSDIEDVARANNGYYVVLCSSNDDMSIAANSAFCINSKGELKWKNEDYVGSNIFFASGKNARPFNARGGIAVKTENTDTWDAFYTLLDIETGLATRLEMPISPDDIHRYRFFDIGDGRVLCEGGSSEHVGNKEYLKMQILDSETLGVIFEKYVEAKYCGLLYAHSNGDGTFTFIKRENPETLLIFRLDAAFNVLNEIALEKDDRGYDDFIHWFYDDGFILIDSAENMGHDNLLYHAVRYNRDLDVVWQTNIECNFFRFMQNSKGEVICYKSAWAPKRACYIDFYGSDEQLNPTHAHDLVHRKESKASCMEEGHGELWQCADCGVMFSDNAGTAILRAYDVLKSPLGVHEFGEAKQTVRVTCKTDGRSERTCSVCGERVVETTPASELYHDLVWRTVEAPTCCKNGILEHACNACGIVLGQITDPANEKNHVAGAWELVKAPTETQAGEERRLCKECGKTMETRTVGIATPPADEPDVPVAPDVPDEPPSKSGGAIILAIVAAIIAAIIIVVVIKKKKA